MDLTETIRKHIPLILSRSEEKWVKLNVKSIYDYRMNLTRDLGNF